MGFTLSSPDGRSFLDKVFQRRTWKDVEETMVESGFHTLFQQLHDVQLRCQPDDQHRILARLRRVKEIVEQCLPRLLRKDLKFLQNENNGQRFGRTSAESPQETLESFGKRALTDGSRVRVFAVRARCPTPTKLVFSICWSTISCLMISLSARRSSE